MFYFSKKRVEEIKAKKYEFEKKAVQTYYTRLYEHKNKDSVEIPYFLLAENDVKELEKQGLISEMYRQLRKQACL